MTIMSISHINADSNYDHFEALVKRQTKAAKNIV